MSKRVLPDTLRGVSAYVAIGRWARPRVQHLKMGGWRLCVGWLSIAVMPRDIECILVVGGDACRTLNEQRAPAPTPRPAHEEGT